VPGEPLFDISGIDLNAVAVSREEVGRLNPQAGDMRHLDYVVWHRDDWSEVVGVRDVRDDEFWVAGHIPGRPLMPGVLMIEAAAQLASIGFRKRQVQERFLAFTRIDDVVFRAQVVPGDRLVLLMKELKFNPRRFVCRTQGLVDDEVAFEATITGMAVGDEQGRSRRVNAAGNRA